MYDLHDRREAIKVIQKYIMKIEGINDLGEEGVYNKKTKDAVRVYQNRRGVGSNGVVDRETWEVMHTDYTEAILAPQYYDMPKLPADVGEYSEKVLKLKSMVTELWEYFPDTEGFERGQMYSERFGEEVRRLRSIYRLKDGTVFDEELYKKIYTELKIRKNTAKKLSTN